MWKIVPYSKDGREGAVAYTKEGNRIFFTGLMPSKIAPSTMAAAEEIVTAILEREGGDWRDIDFIEVSFQDGLLKGHKAVSRLVLEETAEGEMRVEYWNSIGGPRDNSFNQELAKKVVRIFKQFSM